VIVLVAILFEAAEDDAGVQHLDEMSLGADNDSCVTPVRKGRDAVPAAAHSHEETDRLAEPSGAANKNDVARPGIGDAFTGPAMRIGDQLRFRDRYIHGRHRNGYLFQRRSVHFIPHGLISSPFM
jgi:hypothetical protein